MPGRYDIEASVHIRVICCSISRILVSNSSCSARTRRRKRSPPWIPSRSSRQTWIHSRADSRSAFRNLVEQSGVDLVHIPSPWAPTPSPVPLVATIHDVTPLLYPRSLGPTLRMRYKRQLADTVADARQDHHGLADLSVGAERLCGRRPGQGERHTQRGVGAVLSPGRRVDSQCRPPPLLTSGASSYSGWAISGRRRICRFLSQAWARLLRRLPDIPPLVLAGSQTGQFQNRARARLSANDVSDSVLFPGFIRDDDLASLYSAATLFVFPSLYEGFGLPPLEAMACGTPCVVSNSSSLPEVTGSAALLFNPTSLESFEDCVIRAPHGSRPVRDPA